MLGELSSAEVEEVLRAGVIGRMGCVSSGRPLVVPVCYAYDGGYVYGHSAEGRKLRALREKQVLCSRSKTSKTSPIGEV
jgi:nitroimidazol reductase NimA-like FMN-containing flavoprotein (pyridoxamine 5'-phosphate oxidase superfamily)